MMRGALRSLFVMLVIGGTAMAEPPATRSDKPVPSAPAAGSPKHKHKARAAKAKHHAKSHHHHKSK